VNVYNLAEPVVLIKRAVRMVNIKNMGKRKGELRELGGKHGQRGTREVPIETAPKRITEWGKLYYRKQHGRQGTKKNREP